MLETLSNPFATEPQYASLSRRADEVFRGERKFPDYVFGRRDGSLRFGDQIHPWWYELRDFAELHGDRELSVVVVDPAGDLEGIAGPGRRLAFTLSTRATSDDYYDVLNFTENRENPFRVQGIAAWEIRRRPWANTAEAALDLWGLAFAAGRVVPDELAVPFRRNYGSFDRVSDPEAGLPHLEVWDLRDEP